YLEALFCEMEAGAALLKRCGLTLRALYVGGGTPSALGEADFARLMDTVMRLFPNAREYTVEAGRPDTITRGKLETLKRLQIGRISINPQTMNDETLRVIGRDHSAQQTIEAFLLAREMGFSDINMDVIAGLPGENAGHFEHTMAEIERLKPDSLTVHTLAIKRSSRLNLEHAPLPDDAAAAHMVRLGEQTAQALHMRPYYLYRQKYMAGHQQNVGYAVAGAACLYNVDIMEETTSILAMGAGAISKRVFPDRELRIVRAPNVSNVAVYIERVLEMAQRKEQLFKK
ncbi:MAG: coproporphyrinogen dehydrogenase HemZ, partial [Clostridia bacterium]